MSSAALNTMEDQLKNKLNLKYSAASRLIQDAKQDPTAATDAEILQLAETNYRALSKSEQAALQIPESAGNCNSEPEWQTKARLAAQKREAQWEAEANGTWPPPKEDPNALPPNVLSQTTTVLQADGSEAQVETRTQEVELKPPNDDNTSKTVCYCVLL